jgi:hypothetical protein
VRSVIVRRLLALLGLWLALWAPSSAGTRVTQPYAGITLVVRTETLPRPVKLHIAQIDVRAPGIRFTVSPPAGSRENIRQTTLDFLKATGAQLAVNAHFFLPFPSDDAEAWVIGLAASEGRVYSAFESPQQSYALAADAPALNLDPEGRPLIVHRDSRPNGGVLVRERVRLWNAVAGSAQIVTDGRVTIPTYREPNAPRGVLTPGGPSAYSNAKSWYDVANARTVAGVSRDRRVLTLATVDARGGSEGMRVGEVAALLAADYGVWNAINLDGGGSTSMAWLNPGTGQPELLNTSSDNPQGRRVATSLAVFARRLKGGM